MCLWCVQGMLSELQTEMELHYMEEKNLKPVKEPVVGEIYVADHEESWHRVELLEINGEHCGSSVLLMNGIFMLTNLCAV